MSNASPSKVNPPFGDDERLKLLQWHLDRYDRLRSSTSARAAVLLSANAALLAGTILLSNSFLQEADNSTLSTWAMRAFAVLSFLFSASSVAYCTNAIAAWRTIRRMHDKEIPSRFAFNWGDTLRVVDGYSDFVSKLATLDREQITKNGTAELWTAILQHKRRHKHLRYGIHTFRIGIIFFVVAAVTLIFFRG